MTEYLKPETPCQVCKKIINHDGECDCKSPYGAMSAEEYRARFIHPFMRMSKAFYQELPNANIH